MKAPAPKEILLHIAVANLLKGFIAPGWRYTHPASGEHRDKRTAAKLKAMGTQPGWPDLILISPQGVLHSLELKRKGEGLKPTQKDFRDHCHVHGWPWAMADNLEEAVGALKSWDCLRVEITL
jgi:nicotinamidase-related amidase